ncbi:hypothetical protein RB619_01810 [Flavobacterium sp. LHD-80]|uniref:hypothetical protein n=1 Tax=Flavobacterium sp. LHD-80 TaxID=3071411 RepID=UPI0027DFA3E9|nr:hypothetical protein [Flavobacterium sp. LHD-80]MDQ6469361.1 hypothetical protein [Flavobacterium sp. LHD-80]
MEILLIVLIIFVIYIQRDWLCKEYNREVDLNVMRLMKDKNATSNIKLFAEDSKEQFAYQLDRLIAFTFGGFSLIIIRRLNPKNKIKTN